MRLNVGTKIAFGFVVLLVLLVLFGMIVLIDMDTVNKESTSVVKHDVPIIANARQMSKIVVDMETGQRAFCITRKEEFLKRYYNGDKEFARLMGIEKKLVSDKHSQVKRLKTIESLLEQWHTKAARPEIATARKLAQTTTDAERLQELLAKGVGKGTIDELRVVIDEMVANFRKSRNIEARLVAKRMLRHVIDGEIGQKGFMVQGEGGFLEPYKAGKDVYAHIAHLRDLIAGDEENLKLLDKVEALIDKWVKKVDTPEVIIAYVKPEPISNVNEVLRVGTGKPIIDQIKKEFDTFIHVEEDFIAKRYTRIATSTERTRKTIIAFTGFAAIFCLAVGFFIIRGITTPVKKLKNATVEIGKGDLDVIINVKSNDEIGDLATSFTNMTRDLKLARARLEEEKNKLDNQRKELQKANQELDSFVYTASHDLRAPLRGIASFATFLMEDYKHKLDKEGQDHLNEINKGAKRMSELIDDLLLLSRISRITNPYENVKISEIVDSAINRLAFDIKENKVELKISPNLPTIGCDRIKINEVFVNLISNAIKFSSKNNKGKSKVEVGYNDKREFYEFFVKDNGIGIDPKYQKQIFGIFQRLHTDRDYEGTGAGLTIVRRIIDDHEGDIRIESELGKGATFYFTIPKRFKEKKKIGEILVSEGLITENQLKKALRKQKYTG